MRQYFTKNPEMLLLSLARRRAVKTGVLCTIQREDVVIPKRCPLLGIRLFRNRGGSGPGRNSPSLDRIVPSLGYVPGNVIVVSHRANSIKHDATLQELKDLTKNLEKILTEHIHQRKETTHEKTQ